MAHLKAIETRDNRTQRKEWKLALTRRLYEQGYEREGIELGLELKFGNRRYRKVDFTTRLKAKAGRESHIVLWVPEV
ncbi:hypothetical protein [[Phormidium ambiguum] IAM M-71]|nr:hypothetical protein [Phormidium ambiguum]